MDFYLGTHHPHWLARTDVPLFISRRRLAGMKTLPKAVGRWALDSGGFSELTLFGRWETGPAQYAGEAMGFMDRIGKLDFAAVQDWMSEPFMIQRTGLSIPEHQARTIQSYLDLRALAPDVPWMPVLQGYAVDDYLAHHEQYLQAGIDLASLPRVGVGSVCRRQASYQAFELFSALRPLGLRLHGFGLKQGFLRFAYAGGLASFDSLAWSFAARRSAPLPGCPHKSCANCMKYALRWRESLVDLADSIGRRPRQGILNLA